MKSIFTFLSIVIFFFTCSFLNAQNFGTPNAGGEYIFNESETACQTNEQRTQIMVQIKENIQLLKSQNQLAFNNAKRDGEHPLFAWPIRKAANINYNDIYTARYYVDHNSSYPNQVSDFECGTKTYDTSAGYNHSGTDLVTWPFGWKMIDLDGVEIIAAAPGQILYKWGAELDRSCTNNDNFWNCVYIQHADGSVAVYGHMKMNSLTTKAVGEMVEEGEFLGIVGSSGNSSVPHLHFEVLSEIEWNGEGQDIYIDPYAGPCNTLNSDTWWQNQKPHTDPRINAVLTHTDFPVFPSCPQPEITNESDNFDTNDRIYFGIYLRDQLAGTTVNWKIIRPDNSILYNYDFALTAYYDASWWMWYYDGVYNMNGEWKWQATYQGETVTHIFNITGVLGIEEETFETTSIYPNPTTNNIAIKTSKNLESAMVYDVSGKLLKSIHFNETKTYSIDVSNFSEGMYFLKVVSNEGVQETFKFIKQ
jgi:murein DD-endopeptidase MepM/ murein hydrolase activator NlpD